MRPHFNSEQKYFKNPISKTFGKAGTLTGYLMMSRNVLCIGAQKRRRRGKRNRGEENVLWLCFKNKILIS